MLNYNISVVIPTIGRTNLLERAIKSVLKQTVEVVEIIVVVDGKSEEVNLLCRRLENKKIKVFQLGSSHGGSYARNYGINQAKGKWVALLDDDDEWFDNKLEKQIQLIHSYNNSVDMIFSQLVTYNKNGKKQILPRKKWKKHYRIDEYLFTPSFGKYAGYIQTSSILAKKELFVDFPFTNGLPKHQDWDWLLKIQSKDDLIIDCVEQPLLYYHQDISASVGKVNKWRESKKWIDSIFPQISWKSYGFFYILIVIPDMLNDASITKCEKITYFKEMRQNLKIKHIFSLRYIALLLKFFRLLIS
ncbi:glycosyltransferase family 2 protein [Streptococcus suis]|uniref:glycosyltransferase family 2 protein n=1 Tax=Streptococcus suis TaxID=1307 RepID=UPI0005CD3581|nr:glycosyltransferase family 2 protein [Streptococcus suis]AXI67136.1 glycosyltransferase family 2 protein [Streptococcus suis]NQG21521.1 glycosyltransferase family 2 protein [Streptococcus suis]NQH80441.1 glycosyltransferase family 2 protein [Streptococcus suis]HEL1950264.1 glycosyltransferase family 2 protein [Streptococcus suis]HEL2725976.1 glycosyltransferase family 2 protein [Streptococcus suis]